MKIFALILHYNGSSSFVFVNPSNIYQFKAKDSEIKIIHCVKVIFQKVLQLIRKKKKNKIKMKCKIFFLLNFILLILTIFNEWKVV